MTAGSAQTITLSVIKVDIDGFVWHSAMHPALMDCAKERIAAVKSGGLLVEYHVSACGDDLQLIMTHRHGVDHERIHRLAWVHSRPALRSRKNCISTGQGRICWPMLSVEMCTGSGREWLKWSSWSGSPIRC